METPLIEKVAAQIDEIGALLGNLKDGLIYGESVERSIARVDYLLQLVKGE